jgi:small GTP-binding protein
VIQKKICLIGGFGVGKTSLVSRFVHSMFSDRYLTTVGVKIEKKSLTVDAQDVDLVIWDLYGEDEFQKLALSYLRGASGYLLVVDGTRRKTLETALTLQERAEHTVGRVPFILAVNKVDLVTDWDIDESVLAHLAQSGWQVIKTSAKTGSDVEQAFATLARAMLAA